jgi:predicted transcriptional regulator
MKTTVEISDPLFRRIKRLAAERHTTVRALLEAALRRYTESGAGAQKEGFRLRKRTFRGRGLQPGLKEEDWPDIRRRAYGDRGG